MFDLSFPELSSHPWHGEDVLFFSRFLDSKSSKETSQKIYYSQEFHGGSQVLSMEEGGGRCPKRHIHPLIHTRPAPCDSYRVGTL